MSHCCHHQKGHQKSKQKSLPLQAIYCIYISASTLRTCLPNPPAPPELELTCWWFCACVQVWQPHDSPEPTQMPHPSRQGSKLPNALNLGFNFCVGGTLKVSARWWLQFSVQAGSVAYTRSEVGPTRASPPKNAIQVAVLWHLCSHPHSVRVANVGICLDPKQVRVKPWSVYKYTWERERDRARQRRYE